MKKLIYIKPTNSPFIIKDEEILQSEYDVHSFLIGQNKSKIKYFFRLGSLFFYLLFRSGKAKIFVTWFGDYHAAVMVLAARILGKMSVIFAGGQEAICYPELGKGVYLNKFRGYSVRYAMRRSSLIIPNHKSLIYHENSYYSPDNPHIDGISHYVKKFKTPWVEIYNGVDTLNFKRDNAIPKDPSMVLTIGSMNLTHDFMNKGFDLFVEAARKHPELNFILISIKEKFMPWIEKEFKVSEIPNLVIVPSFCPQDKLMYYFNKSKVFVQVSISEGMPNTLCEAIIMGCVPVGSNVNGIPDVMDSKGVLVLKRDYKEYENAILKALTMPSDIEYPEFLKKFSIEKRKVEIIKSLENLLLK